MACRLIIVCTGDMGDTDLVPGSLCDHIERPPQHSEVAWETQVHRVMVLRSLEVGERDGHSIGNGTTAFPPH